MRTNYLKATLKATVLAAGMLLAGAVAAFGQQQVNLSAGPTSLTMPDGSTVPMWGYTCAGSTVITSTTATCAALNPAAAGWSPVVITVPTGQDLQINLTNNLSFTAGTTVPTSLVIVGQLGGGLGDVTQRTTTASPDHSNAQASVTWPIAGPAAAPGTPPTQGPRVQSFSTEVAFGATTSLTWKAPRPGTYLLESGTHPSIQGTMGLYGILVVTTAPTATAGTESAAGTAYPGVTYDAEVPLLFSEIDPVQNNSVNAAVNTVGFSETAVWSGQPGGCGNPSSTSYNTCYPPVVNYTPLYYTINGVAFNKTNASASIFPTIPATLAPHSGTGSVLVRLVNAGSRMHVPSIVGSQTGTAVAPALPPSGFSLIAEDGNPLPGIPRVQSEVFMAPGKTYDVMINGPASGAPALPIFDRELSLSGNATARDAGMLAYIGVNGGALPTGGAFNSAAVANHDSYMVVPGNTLNVFDPSKGVIANDVNVYGVQVTATMPAHGTLNLNANGTFTYVPDGTWATAPLTGTYDTFTYQANGNPAITATVSLGLAPIENATGITCGSIGYTSTIATYIAVKNPGVLATCKDAAGYPLTVATGTVTATGATVNADANGGFTASVSTAGLYSFSFQAKNSQGTLSAVQNVSLTFPVPSNLAVQVLDGVDKTIAITDYRWIIEEDRTFYVDPKCGSNPPAANCPTFPSQTGNGVLTFGTNFHTSYMPVVATGCTGTLSCESGQTLLGQAAVCDVGNGVCRTTASQETSLDPGQVYLDPTKRYYISVLPGDAANPFGAGYGGAPDCTTVGHCGHTMGGAQIAAACTPVPPSNTCIGSFSPVTVLSEPTPLKPSKLSVFVFEDDFPLNGEHDSGGGVDVLATNEPGLGGFEITLFDDAGGSGAATGQLTHDMFNQPLSNSLAGTIDPATGNDACPISTQVTANALTGDGTQAGITGRIVTCPTYESGGIVMSPLAGQAIIANMMPGRYGVVATPAADRIARGEEWLQTNTLDGQKAHDSFLRVGEPTYFQEYGPAGYHVTIGFANPAIINARLPGICNGTDLNLTGPNCNNSVTGKITDERMSRTPDQRLYSSGTNQSFAFTQCYVSIGDPDGEDFAFTKCAADGTFNLSGLPDGSWRITVFDQWNDMLVDGLSTPVALAKGKKIDMGDIAMNQWMANIYTHTFFDKNGDGVPQSNEPGLTLVTTNIRFRDGSFSNYNNTDLNGNAAFNEMFPLFSWYVVETDATRYKATGTHVVYDAGGPADGTCTKVTAPCGTSNIGMNMANTAEQIPLPTNLRVPGAFYCNNADCTDAPSPLAPGGSGGSTGRVDPPWVVAEGWQGFSGQNSFLEFGKKPYAEGENGGIRGHVVYASTRPFDDPQLGVQLKWEPLIPGVTINLYQEGTAPDGTQSLKLVDTTQTSSWDAWAQGFHADPLTPGQLVPNMNCPGQGRDTGTDADLYFFTLYNQPNYLDYYNNVLHGTGGTTSLPANSQFKCYDGMHSWNQIQPAPYDGMYKFPSVVAMDPVSGKPKGTGTAVNGTPGSVVGSNCTICVPDPDTTDTYRTGTPMLPAGTYVVEVVVPPSYELVKEEDKNILIGDNYIAPVTQEFGGLGAIFIIPDQAAVGAAYNANNAQNPTSNLGTSAIGGIDAAPAQEQAWRCVGEKRIVPDYMSIFPGSFEVSPFAGATRNLCDRKEVVLNDQASSQAMFHLFTSTHASAHFTGVITDDYTSEFDPFSPQFGEKFSPPNLPISLKDFNGNEISRFYADQWGTYDGLNYSTWEVNPPNPTGYAPTMMTTCMNDPGTGVTPDPLFNPSYSQFCYEIPFMPGQTQYMDTPVVPTSAFAGAGYNNPDCAYPVATPAISSVTSADIAGPWVSAAGHSLTINALGDQLVNNYGYSGPSATTAPYNQTKVTRHYGFGSTAGTVALRDNTGKSFPLTGVAWSDLTITGSVPSGLANCAVQQQVQFGGSTAQCGELVITAANGKQSVDTVTVTIGGKTPSLVSGNVPLSQTGVGSIQTAIDAASPGDLIIVPLGTYNEMVIMWKPVRLQGVGAASSIINANTQPAGKLDPWRARVACLFGLAVNGQPSSPSNPFDPTGTYPCGGWPGFSGGPNFPSMVVDRLPLEGILGWDATTNGNLAEQLQEPSLMGAYEGGGITVLGKGVNIPAGSTDVFGSGAEATFPTGTTSLAGPVSATGTSLLGDLNPICHTSGSNTANPFPTNFQCNPSSIDGLSVTDSSQGGGGIFIHAWAHNLQVANNRVVNNAGTLTGGISLGQGEFPDAYLAGTTLNTAPGSCVDGSGVPLNTQLPYCFNLNVNLHNNMIVNNSSTGDELFSATPAGSGGVSICTGADYYKFNYNWICGNLSNGDGGGVAHMGLTYSGDIEKNTFVFNQSTNPTIPTSGGGLIVMGAPPDGNVTVNGVAVECGSVTDTDCVPGLSDGTGPGLVINGNLFMGNSAESGTGGALRFQAVNGADVSRFPKPGTCADQAHCLWYLVQVTNNIIANNVAGWDGGGVSLEDALVVNFINNTVVSNDSTASAGVLFNTLGAPLASSQGPTNHCKANCGTTSDPQPAGLVSLLNSPQLTSSLGGITLTCPAGHPNCAKVSFPILENNIFWQNRSFHIGVGALGTGTLNQQNVVALYDGATTTRASSQLFTGACPTDAQYWDIGVRGDTGPTNHASSITLAPKWSVLTSTTGYTAGGSNNTNVNPTVVSQYCNGSRVPPEFQSMGYQVPPGISDATVPNPIFNLTPNATVDEGNNWINMSWGPLSMTSPVTGVVLGNYAPATSSPAVDYIACASTAGGCLAAGELLPAPTTDFFGNQRPNPDAETAPNIKIDVGAVEYQGDRTVAAAPTLLTVNPSTGFRGTTVSVIITGTNLTGASAVSFAGPAGVTGTLTSVSPTEVSANFVITAGAATGARTFNLTTVSGPTNSLPFTVVGPTLTSIAPTSGVRGTGTAVPVTLSGTNLTGTTTITVSGAGITVSGISVVNDTTVNANFTIAGTAGLNARNVSVTTTLGGTSNTVVFTVVAPTLTSIAPTSAARGTSVPVETLTGTGLTGATSVNVVGANITVSNFQPVSDTTVTASLSLTPATVLGTHNVTVTNVGGATTNAIPFTVTGATVTISAPSPVLTSSPANTTTKTGTITVSNTATGANAGPLALTAAPGITKVGTAGGAFTITGGTCTAGFVVNPGGNCTIIVRYAPGTSTATATANVTVTGTGLATATMTGANFIAN